MPHDLRDDEPRSSTHLFSAPPTSRNTARAEAELAKAIHGDQPDATPAEKMALEHLKLLRVFQQEEGRDPTQADQEYWSAHNEIFRNANGV